MTLIEALEARRLMAINLTFGLSDGTWTPYNEPSIINMPATILNTGDQAVTSPIMVEYRMVPFIGAVPIHPDFDDPSAIVFETREVDDDIAPGGQISVTHDLQMPTVSPGRYVVMRKVDSTNVYAESDENDNVVSLGATRQITTGIVIVDGTAGDDRIVVTATGYEFDGSRMNTFELSVNGVTEFFTNDPPIFGFDVRLGDGDDTFIMFTQADAQPGNFGTLRVDGGAGNDRIAGGVGNDTLMGGAGKDNLDGNRGNDRLNGNGGNDKLSGGGGSDRLYGYNGDDYLNGGSSDDRLEGGGGADTLVGESGADQFFTIDSAIDYVFGSGGQDTAAADTSDVLASIEVR